MPNEFIWLLYHQNRYCNTQEVVGMMFLEGMLLEKPMQYSTKVSPYKYYHSRFGAKRLKLEIWDLDLF